MYREYRKFTTKIEQLVMYLEKVSNDEKARNVTLNVNFAEEYHKSENDWEVRLFDYTDNVKGLKER